VIQAAACVPDGVSVGVTDENVQEVNLEGNYDVVGISIMLSCQAPRAYELAAQFRRRGKTVVLGGLHVALCPEEAAAHADTIVVGEGEGLIQEMIMDIERGKLRSNYRRDGFPDMASVPDSRRDLFDKKRFYSHKDWELVDLVETSRGCRFNCYPCCTPFLGGRQHRIRPLDRVLGDIERCSDLLFIVDNSLEQNLEYQKTLFRAMAGMGKRWVSHPLTPEPEVLDLARRAGCWYVYHAIYTISDKIRDRIKMYHDHGIAVEGTILLGLDEHTEDFIRRLVDFLLTIDLDLAEFAILTPFPRTQAYEELESQGRILDRRWERYNAANVVFQPRQMTPVRLQELYEEAWRTFYQNESQHLRMTKLFLDVLRSRKRKGVSGRNEISG
jgi:radical SAM superfamily enzyme YgiQ (UPF0313 family)